MQAALPFDAISNIDDKYRVDPFLVKAAAYANTYHAAGRYKHVAFNRWGAYAVSER